MKQVAFILSSSFLFLELAHSALIAQYGFEEGFGSTAYDSATTDGSATPVDDGSIVGGMHVPGIVGLYALRFQGPGSNVSLEPGGTDNDILNSAPAATFASWVKLDSYPSGIGTIVFFSTSTFSLNSRGGMFISTAGFVEVAGRAQDESGFQSRLSTTQIPLNEWIHLTGVVDFAGDTVEIYFNGQLQPLAPGSIAFPGSATSPTNSLASSLGSTGGTFEFLNGTLDDVRIYNEKLDAAAIAAIVPEPASTAIFGTFASFFAFVRRRR